MLYVGDDVRTVALASIASALSGTPMLLIGPPGCGKTEAAYKTALMIAEGKRDLIWFHSFNPGTPPAVVQGTMSVKQLVDHQVVAPTEVHTVYDPTVRLLVLDEITRANHAVLDGLLNAMDGSRFGKWRLIVATSNTSLESPPDGSFDPNFSRRMSALRSRFGIVIHFHQNHVPVEKMLAARALRMAVSDDDAAERAEMDRYVTYAIPTIGELDAVRRVYSQAAPLIVARAKGSEAVRTLEELKRMAERYNVRLNDYRSASFLASIISTLGVFERMREIAQREWIYARETGDWSQYELAAIRRLSDVADGGVRISPLAADVLRYAGLAATALDQSNWQSAVAHALDAANANIYQFMSRFFNAMMDQVRYGRSQQPVDWVTMASEWKNSFCERFPEAAQSPEFALCDVYIGALVYAATIDREKAKAVIMAHAPDAPNDDPLQVFALTQWPPSPTTIHAILAVHERCVEGWLKESAKTREWKEHVRRTYDHYGQKPSHRPARAR